MWREGFSQVLFLEAVTRNFVDEIGAMNIMFVIDGELDDPFGWVETIDIEESVSA